MRSILLAVALLFLAAATARAACECQCVNGRMQPLCESSIDIRPLCGSTICPIDVAPAMAPLNPPTPPPLGTAQCRQARVCDTLGRCEWRQVCR